MLIPRVAVMLGGAAAGVVSSLWKSFGRGRAHTAPGQAIAKSTAARVPATKIPAKAQAEIVAQYALLQTRLERIESLVERHEEKLRAFPSTQEIVAAMNEVFERSATALDARFAEQARALESLKFMVGQTDELLQKVLDSIYALPDQPPDRERERPSLPQ